MRIRFSVEIDDDSLIHILARAISIAAPEGGTPQPLPRDAGRLLSPLETADLLGVSASTLSVWRCRGRQELPYVKVGSRVMYRQSDIDDYLEGRTRRSSAPE